MRFKPDGTRYTQADILLITADKEATLSKLDYEEWYEKNLGKDGSHQKVTGMFKQPIAKYKDSVYASIKHGNNSALSNFYDVLYDIQTTSSRYYKYLPQGDGFLPNIVDHPTKRGIEHGEEVELLGLDGEIVHQIPFKYIGLLNAKREIYYRGRKYDSLTDTYEDFDTYEQEILKSLLDRGIIQPNQFKSLDEISTYNKTLRKANKEAHGDAVSRDLDKVMPLFITSSTDYKYKNLIESGILLALAELKHQKVTKLNGFGRPIYSNEVDREGNKKLATYEGDSNTYKHANKMVEMIFYDKFLKKGSGDTFLKGLKDYSSVIGMGFNVFAGVKNITYGGFMTAAEATSGRFFTLSDIAEANQDYFSNSMSYLSDITGKEDGATSNEVNGLFHMFNIIESYDEMFELQDPEVSKRFAREMFINTAFAMQHAGEHMMHNMTLLAMLNSHRLYKGKAITINEYLDGKLQVVTPEMIDDNTAYEKVLEHNTQVKATAKEEFEKLPKLRDMFEHVDGYSKIKEEYKNKFSTEEYILFREKVRGVNHLMHGIYNKQDRGTIENKMIGQNLLQFRKWARKGWNKRFGTRGGIMSHQEFWNERVNTNDIGDYKALWKLITKPSTKSGNVFRNAEEKGAYQAISNMLGDYLQAIVRAKFYWNTMTENEKEGIRRAGVELLELAIVFTLSRLLAAAIPDDKKHNRLINFMLYQLSASQTELAAYTPIYGWFNESAKIVANPTATYGLMVNSYKLAKQAFMYPFVSDEKNHFQGGYYNDRLKVEVYAGRMIPGYNVFLRIQALDSQKTAYKLY